MPLEFGVSVLCDLGSAVPLDGVKHREDIHPNVYRAPEIVLDIPWTYRVDIWNVRCMVSVDGLRKPALTDTCLSAYRFGMPLRASTYSLATILNLTCTGAALISLR
jgi:hypothetical protein